MKMRCIFPPISMAMQGLLELEGSLASVLVHLVKRDREASAMLDASSLDTDAVVSVVKERLHGLLGTSTDVTSSMAEKVVSPPPLFVHL